MASLYDVSAEAQADLSEIWQRIAGDIVALADRTESEFHELFIALGRCQARATRARTSLAGPVQFFPLYSFLVVYQPDVKPIRIMVVLRGRRNVKRILRERL